LTDGPSTVSTTRPGYDTDVRTVSIQGDVRLDIEVVPSASYTVSGVVFEVTPSGRAPLEGVYVTGSWDYPVTTDSNGTFRLCAASECRFYNGDSFGLSASKAGYQSHGRTVTVRGDTILEIQLVRQ
jgi:hypothetical protein